MVKIDQAFIQSFIDGGFNLEIAYENESFNPSAQTAYVELLNIPNDITPLSINETNETDGLFRIVLYWPADVGAIAAKIQADTILAAYTIGSKVCYDS